MMWELVLVALVACGDPAVEVLKGGFVAKAQCELALGEYAYNQGPPQPGSYYECRSHQSAAEWNLPPYKVYGPPNRDRAYVQVWLLSEPEVRARCSGAIGCYIEGVPGLIIAPAPKDFNDRNALWVLGHELLHALGAKHD